MGNEQAAEGGMHSTEEKTSRFFFSNNGQVEPIGGIGKRRPRATLCTGKSPKTS